MEPKLKPVERTAIYEPATQNLLTHETEILKATPNYNIWVLTKNTVHSQNLDEARKKQDLHESIMQERKKVL